MHKISVIVPVYNVGKYLKQCLNSIVSQGYQNLEIICINDCSTDNSLDILEEYSATDKRFRIINQKVNQGQGIARNIGIKQASGEYILFVDPDDWIEGKMFEELNYFIDKYNMPDVIQFDFNLYNENIDEFQRYNFAKKFKRRFSYDLIKKESYTWENCKKHLFTKIIPVCWNKIYSKKYLIDNDIRFGSEYAGEDCIFWVNTALSNGKIFYVDKSFYNYRRKFVNGLNNSTLNTFKPFKSFKYLKDIEQYVTEKNLIKDLGKDLFNYKINEIYHYYSKAVEPSRRSDFVEYAKQYLSDKEFAKFIAISRCNSAYKKIFYIEKNKENGIRNFNIHILNNTVRINKYTVQKIIDSIRGKLSFTQLLVYKTEGIKYKSDIKTLILGSSHLANGYWAADSEYNLSMPSQDLYYAYNLYKKFNRSDIKNIIISFSVFTPGLSIIKTNCCDFCIPYKMLLDIDYQDAKTATEKQLYLKEDNCRTEIENYKKNLKIKACYNGNLLKYPHRKFNTEKAHERALKHLKNCRRENSQMKYCVDILETAKENNQNVYFLLPPTTKEYREVLPSKDIIFKELISLADRYSNAKILNYFDTNLFDERKDFTNEDHLNKRGAIKLANLIRKEINE